MTWTLKCLLCSFSSHNLVEIQEHAMEEHGYTQQDHRQARRRELNFDHYTWTMPDGREWMEAKGVASCGGEKGSSTVAAHE
jgi:hypothetical protein